jgi:hypothetical protein
MKAGLFQGFGGQVGPRRPSPPGCYSRTYSTPEVAQPRRFTHESVDNALSATENHSVYNLEGSHRGKSQAYRIENAPQRGTGRMRASSSWPLVSLTHFGSSKPNLKSAGYGRGLE